MKNEYMRPAAELSLPVVADTKAGDPVRVGAINGVAMGLIPRMTRFAGRVQSGYLFHYAFGMVLGLLGLLIWVMARGMN